MRDRSSYEVRNALQVGELSEGGYTVPDEFEHILVEALQEENIMRGLVHVITTSSGDRKIPLVTSKGAASWVEEESVIPESDDGFGQITLSAHKVGSMIRISEELLRDSAFDLAAYIRGEFARRVGAAEESAILAGDGSHKPTGLLHDTLGAELGVTAAASAAIIADELLDLQHSLKAGYRRKAAFIMNDATVKLIRKLKDNNGQFMWQPGLLYGQPDTLLNQRVLTSNYMPLPTAGNKAILYGDYNYYWLADREGRSLQRLNELYAATDQVGFKITQRVDGRLILPEAVKVLKMKIA
jgi:HK97 family phage major capsid protein